MGALPSRESNEDPASFFPCDCGRHVAVGVPLTPHFFPSPDSLAFRQLFHARNHQSAVYGFHLHAVDGYLPPPVAESYRKAQEEDWGDDVAEIDPSLHYYDNPTEEEKGGGKKPSKSRAIEDPETLYDFLVRLPIAEGGGLVDTNVELLAALTREWEWEAAGGVFQTAIPPPRFLSPLPKAILVELPRTTNGPDDENEKNNKNDQEKEQEVSVEVARRRYCFESSTAYRDGRVHLVEEDGMLFYFAYKKRGGGEREAEEGDFLIPITPVRVVGVHGLLPSRSRGSPWLRGNDTTPLEDAVLEQLPFPPPVRRLCRFIEGTVGERVLNRVALAELKTYREVCHRAGLPNSLVRPIWALFLMTNIPSLQLVREMYYRARAAVAEVEHGDQRLRQHIMYLDRENDFAKFLRTNWEGGSGELSPENLDSTATPSRWIPDVNVDPAQPNKKEEDEGDDLTRHLPPPNPQRHAGDEESKEINPEGVKEEKQGPKDPVIPFFQTSFKQDFSSRLEPFAPYALESLYKPGAAENLVLPPPGSGKLPSYVLQDELEKCEEASHKGKKRISHNKRENDPSMSESEETKPYWVALYKGGMMETIRGRSLLFRIRQDALEALLYYFSLAIAPNFIAEYLEPTDATSLTYCGPIRLSGAVGESPGDFDTLERSDLHPDVLTEHIARGLMPIFSASDPSPHARGPSAEHRLKRMVLQPPPDPASLLALQQQYEREHEHHVKSYAPGDFRDGDLMVYNCDTFTWEHYEHVRLRMQFERLGITSYPTGEDHCGNPATSVQCAQKAPCARAEKALGDPGMEARVLCVGLDILLLSWSKWVKDNRFFEDRNDPGWLRTTETRTGLVQVGRYFIWSCRLNRERFLYGVIPKFIKDRVRRMRHANRNKETTEARSIMDHQWASSRKAQDQRPQDGLTKLVEESHRHCDRLAPPKGKKEKLSSEITVPGIPSRVKGAKKGNAKSAADSIPCGAEDDAMCTVVPMIKLERQEKLVPDCVAVENIPYYSFGSETAVAMADSYPHYNSNRRPHDHFASSVSMSSWGTYPHHEMNDLSRIYSISPRHLTSLLDQFASPPFHACGFSISMTETPLDYHTSPSWSSLTRSASSASVVQAKEGARFGLYDDAGNTTIQVNKRTENRYFPLDPCPPLSRPGSSCTVPGSSPFPPPLPSGAPRGRRCYERHCYYHKHMRGHISPVALADAVAVSGINVQVRIHCGPDSSQLNSLASSPVAELPEWLMPGKE